MPLSCAGHCAIDRVAIVVPARDERNTIAAALVAIGRAVGAASPDVACHVTVVDDGSVDATGRIAAHVLTDLGLRSRVVHTDRGCVGAARRIGIEATTSTWLRPEHAWILSTDADSTVRPDWIVRHLRHADNGAPAVSGIVDLISDEHRPPLQARWWADYGGEIDGRHRHPYAHGTNLGVRLDAYRAVGGFRDMTGQEDGDLWRRLRSAGFHPVADARIVVDTSARRIGRAPTGFAHALSTRYHEPQQARGGRDSEAGLMGTPEPC